MEADEQKNWVNLIRAGINQAHYSQPKGKLIVNECVAFTLIAAVGLGIYTLSFWVFMLTIIGGGFFWAFALFVMPIIGYFLLGVCWAAPFWLLGAFHGSFYLVAVLAFFLSFVVHYWGMKYWNDLDY